MTDKTKPKANNAESKASSAIAEAAEGASDVVSAANAGALDLFSHACRAGFNGWASMNSEIADFMAKRLKHDADLSASLARCENWEDAVALQQDWARETAEEYMEEASRLMDLSSKLANDHWKPVWQQADEMVSSMARGSN